MGEELVRVESFGELRTGVRVFVVCRQTKCTTARHIGLLGTPEVAFGRTVIQTVVRRLMFDVMGEMCCGRQFAVDAGAVDHGLVFRFASDVDNDASLAAEENPYLSREAIGTGGRDEVRVARKEKAR